MNPAKSVRALLLPLALLLAAMPAAAEKIDDVDRAEIADSMRADFDNLLDQGIVDGTEPIEPLATVAPGDDPASVVLALMRGVVNRVLAVRNGYLQELDKLGWDAILDPTRLQKDKNMRDSRRMIDAARQAITQAKVDTLAIIDGFPDVVAGSSLSPADQRGIIAGYREGLDRDRYRIDAQFQLELDSLDVFADMIDMLEDEDWDVEDGQFVFATDDAVATFNAHLNRIAAILARQEAAQSESVERTRDALDALTD